MSQTDVPPKGPVPAPDRRLGPDRRRPPTFPPEFSRHRRRSSAGRRKTDGPGYVDIYDPATWIVAFGVLGLSCLDAVMTAVHLQSERAYEVNPLMAMAINMGGIYTFMGVKSALTVFPLALIVLHKEWKLARFAARLVLMAYVLVGVYHFYLLSVTS